MSDAARPVVVTRAEVPGSGLTGELARIGLAALHWPVIDIEPTAPDTWCEARKAIDTFDWIVFTSVHAVDALADALPGPPRARIGAVGPATAETLRERGWRVDLTGSSGAQGLLGALAEVGVRSQRVLHPAGSRALPTLSRGLEQLGAEVVSCIVYHTVANALDVSECRRWIARRGVSAVTFASPSAVTELAHALGERDFFQLLADAPALAIGPTTARQLAARGVAAVTASAPTLRALALACRGVSPGSPDADPDSARALRAESRPSS
ncbi:MAG: uroporphyrinogen-III synthase [Steroidobacteraceae bacterium]